MLRRFCLASLIILPLASLAAAQTATASDLAWKFTNGQKLQIEINQQMHQEIQIAGNPNKSSTDTSTWITWEVKDVDESGNAKVESIVSRVLLNMDAPMVGKVTIDTQSDEQPSGMAKMISDTLKPMVGVPMTQTMNARGEILDMQIPEEALKGMQQPGMPAMGSPAEMIKQMAKSAALIFPEGGVTVGQKFTSTSEAKTAMGAITTTNEYTYQGEEEKDDRMLQKFDVVTNVKFGGGDNAMNAKFDVTEQTSDGTLYFDAEAGRLDSSEVHQVMKVKISVAGQELDQQMNQKVTTKVTEVE